MVTEERRLSELRLILKQRRRGRVVAPRKPLKARDGFYGSWEWLKVRYVTLKRWGAVCMCCGAREGIVVDHIRPRSRYPGLQLDPENLQVLCGACNRGKSNDDETDWRPR